MSVYYNEYDKGAAQWLRELIVDGLIPAGEVDERNIKDVVADDVRGFTQCHFFAGIGGWTYALQLAGWPTDRPIWTGSCPCQPFSQSGKQKGFADERHLWPEFYRLIAECRPSTVFGEQVASGLGREWLAGVRADLEDVGYAVGAADLCAAGSGAPHIRQRLYWVADAKCGATERYGHQMAGTASDARGEARQQWVRANAGDGVSISGLGNTDEQGLPERESDGPVQSETLGSSARQTSQRSNPWTNSVIIHCRDGKFRRIPSESALSPLVNGPASGRMGILRGAGNAIVPQTAATFIEAFRAADGG